MYTCKINKTVEQVCELPYCIRVSSFSVHRKLFQVNMTMNMTFFGPIFRFSSSTEYCLEFDSNI